MNISLTERANLYSKATRLVEVDSVVQFEIPMHPNHEFFVDFSDVRGEFEEKAVYKALNISPEDFTYNYKVNADNKTLLFLAGMRGSGKTSELLKIIEKLNSEKAFFCVFCSLDVGLDINDMEYMDILVFQLERLFEELQLRKVEVNNAIIESMQTWFSQRINEVNYLIRQSEGFELEIKAGTPSLVSFLGIMAKVKTGLLGTRDNADKIRTVLKNNFSDFVLKINDFFNHVNDVLRQQKVAQELLFVVDGLEKVATKNERMEIVDNEAGRMRQVKTNTIFTLPIELMQLQRKLEAFSTIVSFPFVKVKGRNGNLVQEAIQRFEEFVYKRIDISLFDKAETVQKAIMYSGGSPRELLRILQYANIYADDKKGFIDEIAMNKAITKLAAQSSHYVSQGNLNNLKTLKQNNDNDVPTAYDEEWQDLFEKLLIMNYNSGSYKRVNPIIEVSKLYQHYVLNPLETSVSATSI